MSQTPFSVIHEYWPNATLITEEELEKFAKDIFYTVDHVLKFRKVASNKWRILSKYLCYSDSEAYALDAISSTRSAAASLSSELPEGSKVVRFSIEFNRKIHYGTWKSDVSNYLNLYLKIYYVLESENE